MSILVTGGAGYIGSHMAHELVDSGEAVIVLDDLSTGFPWALPSEAALVVGDVGDEKLVFDLLTEHNVETIVHFAAKIVVPESVTDPVGYYINNTAKALSLINCATRAGVRYFIFSSTAAVYGDPQSNPVSEDDPLAPVSPYGRSKLMVEWALADAARAHALRTVILRYFNVAGADPAGRTGQSTPTATHLIKVAVQAALGHRTGMEVFGSDYPTQDGSCVRDYIHVSDLARAHRDSIEYLRAGGQNLVCNCGYERGYSVLEVIDVVKRVSGVDFPVRLSGRRAGDPAAIVASTERIRSTLGWFPRYDNLEIIVAQAFEWERRLNGKLQALSAAS